MEFLTKEPGRFHLRLARQNKTRWSYTASLAESGFGSNQDFIFRNFSSKALYFDDNKEVNSDLPAFEAAKENCLIINQLFILKG